MHGADAGSLGRSVTDVNDHARARARRTVRSFACDGARLEPEQQTAAQRPVPSRYFWARYRYGATRCYGVAPRPRGPAPPAPWALGPSGQPPSPSARGGSRARPVRWRGSQSRRDALRDARCAVELGGHRGAGGCEVEVGRHVMPVGRGPRRPGQTGKGKWPVKSSGGAPASEALCTGAINLTNPSLLVLQLSLPSALSANQQGRRRRRCSA